MTLIFGLLSALIPRLGFLTVSPGGWGRPPVFYPPFSFELHEFSFPLLIASCGGCLGILSSVRGVKWFAYLGFQGNFANMWSLVILQIIRPPGFVLLLQSSYASVYGGFYFPSIGYWFTLFGIMMMFTGLIRKSRTPRIVLLSVPMLLLFWLTAPLMIVTNYSYFLVLSRIQFINELFGSLIILGLLLMFIGNLIAELKFMYPAKKQPLSTTEG